MRELLELLYPNVKPKSQPPEYGDVRDLHKGTLEVHSSNGVSRRTNYFKTQLETISEQFQMRLVAFPDCSEFHIKLGDYNPHLLSHGVLTRYGSAKRIITYKNRRLNRYLYYMYYRLARSKLEKKPKLYWKIACQLLIYSNAYLISNIHYKDKGWVKTKTYTELKKIIDKVQILRGRKSLAEVHSCFRNGKYDGFQMLQHYIDYKRSYLPKGSTYRPLGVPVLSWRVYNSMLLHMLVGFYTIKPQQHGFIPGRGCLTAWKSLMGNIPKSRNILEIDFEGYYPSLSSEMIFHGMRKLEPGSPFELLDFIKFMNESKPKLKNPNTDHENLKLLEPLDEDDWLISKLNDLKKIWNNRKISAAGQSKA